MCEAGWLCLWQEMREALEHSKQYLAVSQVALKIWIFKLHYNFICTKIHILVIKYSIAILAITISQDYVNYIQGGI